MARKNKRLIKAEDLYKIKVISDIRISPSGEHVVFTRQRVNPKTEEKYSNLWIISTKGGKAKQFTFGKHKDCQARWSPDGNTIAYLSNHGDPDEPAQMFIIPFKSGKPRQLTHVMGTVSCVSWSPNGKKLLCRIRKLDQEQLERQEDDQAKKLGTVSRHYQRVFYKLDGEGYLPKERWHIWVVNTRNGRAKQMTDHDIYDENDPTWSPDGKKITFI